MTEKEPISDEMLEHIRRRQQVAWARLAPQIDDFVREMHEGTGNLVMFCSDHGDVFGEHGWQYHFSNVSDGGNQVPLYILEPGQDESHVVEEKVSMRHMHDTVLKKSGVDDGDLVDMTDLPERSSTILESYWYNRDGKTLDQYRFNQFAFTHDNNKYIKKNDEWMFGRVANGIPESEYEGLGVGVDPIEELDFDDQEEQKFLREQHRGFEDYSNQVL
jgi:arylsulfatase A-like enzyme